MILNEKTCTHCGFQRSQCVCGKKRNTSGDVALFNNYTDFRGTADYALTSRISRTNPSERKLMEELQPIDGEELTTFIKRTDIAEEKLNEYSIAQHLWLTKKGVWACHSGSRYCFICTLVQLNNCNKAFLSILPSIIDISNLRIRVDTSDPEHPPKLSLFVS